MNPEFWHEVWAANQIGFHQSQFNPLMVAHFNTLPVTKGSRVFVPLCGKTLDIAWLLAQGYRVAGAELSETAIQQLFVELGVEPAITERGQLKHYSATDIDIFVGDIFHLTGETLGSIDAVYDRAALVALPESMRVQYTRHLVDITDSAPQFLITFEYDQRVMDGPPFSIRAAEVSRHYQDHYNISVVASVQVVGGLKGQVAATEDVWVLQ